MDYVSDVGRAPLSVQEIAAKAIQFDYNNTIPLRYWLRTADTLLKEADIYEREGNEQQAYMLLLRHAELVLKYLPDHPDAKLAEYARHMRALKTRLADDIRRLERLKPRIFAQYVAYEEAQKEREARRAALDANRTSTRSPVGSVSSSTSTSTQQYIPYSYNRTPPVPSQNNYRKSGTADKYLDLSALTRPRSGSSSPAAETQKLDAQFAVQVARKEFARREAERLARGVSKSSNSRWRDKEVEKVSSPVTDNVEDRYAAFTQQYKPYSKDAARERGSSVSSAGSDRSSNGYDLQKQMQALNLQATSLHQDHAPKDSASAASSRPSQDSIGRSWVYNYPSIPKRPSSLTPSPAPLPQFPPSIVSTPPTDTSYDRPSPPPVPPLPESLRPPAVPKKTPLPPLTPPPLPTPPAPFSATSPPSLPSLPLTLTSPPPPPKLPLELIAPSTTITISPSKQRLLSDFQFPSTARLESGQRLRTIFLPSLLRHKFLAIAFPNTRRNLETCGVLCGTLIQNALFISRLVIPEQVVTSDTCNMTDEESLFHYVDSEDLMVLGWIHTHPMYECFMSSVDLHNHCGYQLMLPESIAVVCAPRFTPDWGVFRLTDPPGVKRIMECREKSLFHRHEGAEGLYTDALRPGHVVEVGEMEFEVVDLRK